MKFAQAFFLILMSAMSGSLITYIQFSSNENPSQSIDTSIADTTLHRVVDNENCSFDSGQPANLQTLREETTGKQPGKKTPETPTTPNENESVGLSLQQIRYQRRQIDNFRENIASLKSQSPLETVKNQFQSQPIDYEWSLQQEENVLSLFESETALNDYSPLDVSCKSETCQIVMAAETEQKGKAIYEAFIKANHQNQISGINTSISYFSDPNNGQIVMYTSETGVEALFSH